MANLYDQNGIPDASLVQAALKKSDDFVFLLNRYQEPIARFVARLNNYSLEDNEDLLQQIWLKVYLNLNSYKPEKKFSSWLYAIARNQTISYHRKRQTRAEGHQQSLEDLVGSQLAAALNLEEDLHLRLEQDRVKEALKTIKPKFREILILSFLEEKNYQEISEILKKPTGTVASLLNRAKKSLREKLEL